MKKISLLFPILFILVSLTAQQIPIGAWQEHLSYKNAISVTEGGGMVYCATTSGIFSYKKSDNSMTRLSKVNGLSDVEAVVVEYNPYNGKVLIAYKNSNLDLIEGNNNIINIPDIKRKSIIGNKAINSIYFINQFAYLSCGFGIVVFDTERNEVKDTYYIGAAGSTVNVRDITSDGSYLYVASDNGIYRALLSNPNLANFNSWTLINDVAAGINLVAGVYNAITSFNGNIYTNYSKYTMTNAYGEDSLFVFDGTSWSHFIPSGWGSVSGYIIPSLKTCNNQLVINREYAIFAFDSGLTGTAYFSGYFSDQTRANNMVLDNTGAIWIADKKYGLVSWRPGIGYASHVPNGPASENVLNMSLSDDQLWVTPGSYGKYLADGLYKFKDEEWSNIKGIPAIDSLYDFMNVLVDP
ncbi:MAG: hypothetical protein H0X46_08165, partial [Bacteroidetes bacterium]|nr:hypothetical protein [Bacteroidota bacterium]